MANVVPIRIELHRLCFPVLCVKFFGVLAFFTEKKHDFDH